MTPTTILAQALQSIPANIRYWLLVCFSVVVGVLAVCRIFEVDLAYDKINELLVLLGGYFGVQSAANVTRKKKVHDADPE